MEGTSNDSLLIVKILLGMSLFDLHLADAVGLSIWQFCSITQALVRLPRSTYKNIARHGRLQPGNLHNVTQTYIQLSAVDIVEYSFGTGSLVESVPLHASEQARYLFLNVYYLLPFPPHLLTDVVSGFQGFSSATFDMYFSRSKLGSDASLITADSQYHFSS